MLQSSAVLLQLWTILITTIKSPRPGRAILVSYCRGRLRNVLEGGLLVSELDCPPRTGCVSGCTSRASFASPSFSPASTPWWARALNRDSGSKEPPPSVPPPWQPTPCRRRRGLLALLPLRGWLTSGVTTNTYLHVLTVIIIPALDSRARERVQTGVREEKVGRGETRKERGWHCTCVRAHLHLHGLLQSISVVRRSSKV